MRTCLTLLAAALVLTACEPATDASEQGITMDEAETFDAIGPEETIRLTGTEPFWGGQIAGQVMRYSTPDNIDGDEITVERFAGNNGLSYSGTYQGAALDLAITPGDCSDAMSDRSYPLVATLQIEGDTRFGCAWTDAMPFEGPEAP